jgi:hypothetical protein
MRRRGFVSDSYGPPYSYGPLGCVGTFLRGGIGGMGLLFPLVMAWSERKLIFRIWFYSFLIYFGFRFLYRRFQRQRADKRAKEARAKAEAARPKMRQPPPLRWPESPMLARTVGSGSNKHTEWYFGICPWMTFDKDGHQIDWDGHRIYDKDGHRIDKDGHRINGDGHRIYDEDGRQGTENEQQL